MHVIEFAAAAYEPASQLVHAVAPAAAVNVPVPQDTHVAEEEAPVAVEYVPTAHDEAQLVLPALPWYNPAAQAVHTEAPATE